MTTDNADIGKALAPDTSMYDLVEGADDPLAAELSPNGDTVIEEPLPAASPSGDLVDLSLEEPEFNNPMTDTIPPIDQLADGINADDVVDLDANEPPVVADIDVGSDNWGELSDNTDIHNPEQLVAAVLDKARGFVRTSADSPNSLRRAYAFCEELESFIIEGVTQDAKHQKLSLAQLELLDSIEEGIHVTKANILKSGSDTVNGKRVVEAHRADLGIYYDPFCCTVARILINAQVAGGKKVQEVFASIKGKYSIDEREQLQICQIMGDLGYPVRSLLEGQDMIQQYYA